MAKKILVTGGTGQLGTHVVRLLRQAGHDVRIASRRTGDGLTTVDWKTGAGLDDAVGGVAVIVHCASQYSGNDVEHKLVAAARKAGVGHIVHISIVGVDKIPFFYYRAKLAGEQVITSSGVPWTVLRATQFHDLIRAVLAMSARLGVMVLPDLRFQPVEAREVAERLATLAAGEPAGQVADMGGPVVHDIRELARTYLRATGRRRLVVPIRLPGRAFRAYRQGWHLAPEHADGKVTFVEHLAEHPDNKAASYRGKR